MLSAHTIRYLIYANSSFTSNHCTQSCICHFILIKYTTCVPTPSISEHTFLYPFLFIFLFISKFPLSTKIPHFFLYTSTFNILFPLSICISYPDKKVMNSFQTLSILYSVFLHHYLSVLWYYSIDITILLILAHKCRSHILQLNFTLSIYVTVCQHLLRTSFNQNPLTVYTSEPKQRYLTADATAPHLPATKETNKIGFTMSSYILKIFIF